MSDELWSWRLFRNSSVVLLFGRFGGDFYRTRSENSGRGPRFNHSYGLLWALFCYIREYFIGPAATRRLVLARGGLVLVRAVLGRRLSAHSATTDHRLLQHFTAMSKMERMRMTEYFTIQSVGGPPLDMLSLNKWNIEPLYLTSVANPVRMEMGCKRRGLG